MSLSPTLSPEKLSEVNANATITSVPEMLQHVQPIADINSRLLRAIAHVSKNDRSFPYYKCLATIASTSAMRIIGYLEEEHTLETYTRRRLQQAGGNQTSEAIQTIMQELLQTIDMSDDELVEPARLYYFALSSAAPWWPSKEREALLFPLLKSSAFLFGVKEPFRAFRNRFIGDEKPEREASGGGVFNMLMNWLPEEKVNELESLLPCVAEMSRQTQLRWTSSTCYSDFLFRRREFFVEYTDVFANLEYVKEFCNAVRVGTEPDVPGSVWFRPFFDVVLVEEVIKKLASCGRAMQWTEGRVGKADLKEDIQTATSYLFNMYSVAGLFSRILSQRKASLGEAYLQACRENVVHLVIDLDGRYVEQSKKLRSGRRGKGTWDGYVKHKIVLTQEMLAFISNAVTQMEGAGDAYCNYHSKKLDGTSSYNLLVGDILSGLYMKAMHPSCTIKQKYELLQTVIKDTNLHPDIEAVVRAFSDVLQDQVERQRSG